MQKLIYVGPDPAAVGLVPLPEGWPASDHDEPDKELAAAKVASGNYRVDRGRKPAATEEE